LVQIYRTGDKAANKKSIRGKSTDATRRRKEPDKDERKRVFYFGGGGQRGCSIMRKKKKEEKKRGRPYALKKETREGNGTIERRVRKRNRRKGSQRRKKSGPLNEPRCPEQGTGRPVPDGSKGRRWDTIATKRKKDNGKKGGHNGGQSLYGGGKDETGASTEPDTIFPTA